jgi:hypothetical protein
VRSRRSTLTPSLRRWQTNQMARGACPVAESVRCEGDLAPLTAAKVAQAYAASR